MIFLQILWKFVFEIHKRNSWINKNWVNLFSISFFFNIENIRFNIIFMLKWGYEDIVDFGLRMRQWSLGANEPFISNPLRILQTKNVFFSRTINSIFNLFLITKSDRTSDIPRYLFFKTKIIRWVRKIYFE